MANKEDSMSRPLRSLGSVLLRCALGLGFLSAVADRFGLWGPFGQPNVEWGNFSRFLDYTHTLNWYWPAGMIPALGVGATGAELLLGLLLLVGWHTRAAAVSAALLLLTFALAMTLALGIKASLNFAVFTGVGGALLLASSERFPFSVDALLFRRTRPRPEPAPGQLLGGRPQDRKEQMMTTVASVFLLLVSSSVLANSANAQAGTATTLMTKDLPDLPGKEGMMQTVAFAPGEASQRHRHNADLFVYVLEGSIITQLEGGAPRTVHAGDVFYESPTDVHSVSRNASETEPATLLVFYVKAKGAPPTVILGEEER
jgi:quercetin dioxygenase-like cupin family protein/uncharacterized membrane protein YphA (DoxX/SURF4 family)